MKSVLTFLISAMIGVAVLGFAIGRSSASAQNVKGETWRTTSSMEMQGISIPPVSIEVCVPVGDDPLDAMMQQQDDSCLTANHKRSGNKISADLKCGGMAAMEGRLELETLGDTIRGTMTMKTPEGAMTTKIQSTKLGKACEPKIVASSKNPGVKTAVPSIDVCQMSYDTLKNIGDQEDMRLFFQANMFLSNSEELGQDCTKHPTFKNFCAEVQTLDGFLSLDLNISGQPLRLQSGQYPLPASLEACGLGSGNAATLKVQAKLLPQAEKESRWSFLLRYGADEYYPKMVELAKNNAPDATSPARI